MTYGKVAVNIYRKLKLKVRYIAMVDNFSPNFYFLPIQNDTEEANEAEESEVTGKKI